MADLLSDSAIQDAVGRLQGWQRDGNSIHRTYKHPSFRSALAFVQYVGELAEAADHHPDLDIRYSKVTLTLSTHSAGGLTEKDFDLAGQVDQVG